MSFAVFSAVVAFVCLSDALSKYLIRLHLPLGSEIKLCSIFSLVHIQNTGIAFGLFQERNWIFIGVGLVMTVVIVMLAKKLSKNQPLGLIGLGMILGGAFGNLADRIRLGHVTDFLDFHLGIHHWPAFNVADSAICVGAALVFWQSLQSSQKSHPF